MSNLFAYKHDKHGIPERVMNLDHLLYIEVVGDAVCCHMDDAGQTIMYFSQFDYGRLLGLLKLHRK